MYQQESAIYQEKMIASGTETILDQYSISKLNLPQNLKITFNSMGLGLGGGNRIILELSRKLKSKGHDVQINAIGRKGDECWFGDVGGVKIKYDFPSKATRLINQKMLGRSFRDVQAEMLTEMAANDDSDINVATFCLTANPTIKSGTGRKFYLVQNYEPLFFDDPYFIKKAEKSYTLPLKKLCVSKWLQQKVGGIYIGNAVSSQIFKPKNSFEEKEDNSVLYLHRGIPWKGDTLALETLQELFKLNSHVKIHIVTRNNLPKVDFPYIQHSKVNDIELSELYSKVRVLLYTSKFEGYGLPPLEALSCNTNVVSTNFEGNEYLYNGINCLIADNKNSLAKAIQEFFTNDILSQKQIEEGRKTAQNHSFTRMVNRMLAAFGE